MTSKPPFKWRHFAPDIINRGVRWYCLYPISYRNLEEMMCDARRACREAASRSGSGSHYALTLGSKVCARTRQTNSPAPEADE